MNYEIYPQFLYGMFWGALLLALAEIGFI